MSVKVPPPPEPQVRVKRKVPRRKLNLAAPLDTAFLGRTYISTLWLGLLWTVCAYGITQSGKATGSFVGGLLLGALLLKSQELFVRRVLAPRGGVGNSDLFARIPIALLLPLKYIVIGLAFGLFIDAGWLHPAAFASGFLTQQLVIFSKVMGRFLANHFQVDAREDASSEDTVETQDVENLIKKNHCCW